LPWLRLTQDLVQPVEDASQLLFRSLGKALTDPIDGQRADLTALEPSCALPAGRLTRDQVPGRFFEAGLFLCQLTLAGVHDAEGGDTMPLYLTKFNYTPATWAKLIANPEDRRTAAQSYIESVGGKLHGFWYAFGTHDGYNLWEAPDNVSMAAVAMAISGGGAISSYETTVLLTVEETMAAMRTAGAIRYRAPGA
jgi:uncharacterized protein with GYD domain